MYSAKREPLNVIEGLILDTLNIVERKSILLAPLILVSIWISYIRGWIRIYLQLDLKDTYNFLEIYS